MNKSEIRKKILKIRRQKNSKKSQINFNYILKILKKEKIKGNIIGGYYPYNYELDIINILKKFEKKKLYYFITKNNEKRPNGFF